jgi:hypothetical protein
MHVEAHAQWTPQKCWSGPGSCWSQLRTVRGRPVALTVADSDEDEDSNDHERLIINMAVTGRDAVELEVVYDDGPLQRDLDTRYGSRTSHRQVRPAAIHRLTPAQPDLGRSGSARCSICSP